MTTTALGTDWPTQTAHECATTSTNPSLAERARQSIQEDCPHAFYFRFLRLSSRNGDLTIRGCLPSFYLKQVLIAHLQRVENLHRINDEVDVVSSSGLSSVRRRSVA